MPDPAPKTFADFARPAGAATLDAEHSINANLRDNGVGLVPRVLNIDQDAGSATIGCGAIVAIMSIPLGWHVIDDGRRVLLFDPKNQIQVNFRLVDEGVESANLIEQTLAHLAPNAGEAKWITLELAGMKTLAIRGLPIHQPGEDTVLVDQVFMYKSVPGKPTGFCEIRSTADIEKIEPVMDMVELIVDSMQFPT